MSLAYLHRVLAIGAGHNMGGAGFTRNPLFRKAVMHIITLGGLVGHGLGHQIEVGGRWPVIVHPLPVIQHRLESVDVGISPVVLHRHHNLPRLGGGNVDVARPDSFLARVAQGLGIRGRL